ncbi:MAG: hypothetical protein EAZ92_13105 [Candidatus Kapaibacterium sp.]|nr:MAG: hypothetical protein EAZ92_13105 [Candidatus Kapabacteria bacterium]
MLNICTAQTGSTPRRYWAEEGLSNWRATNPDAQTLEMGVRYLKLGNTYREAGKYELAQNYLRFGLDIVRARGSRYWEAVGNEYAGLFFRDIGDRLTSLDYLRRAEYLYRSVLSSNSSETSLDALRKIERDVQYDYGYANYSPSASATPRPNPDYSYNSSYNSSYDYSSVSAENQRLRDINRALQLRISDLEARIRILETPMVGR